MLPGADSVNGLITGGLYLVAALSWALALFVLCHTPGKPQNRVFAVTGASVALWTLTNALFRQAQTPEVATLWAQLSYVAALSTAASFLHFAHLYPSHYPSRASRASTPLLPGLWAAALLLGLLPFVPCAVITGIDLER